VAAYIKKTLLRSCYGAKGLGCYQLNFVFLRLLC
jgi:hypothetical protein